MGRARKQKVKYVQPGYRHRARAAPPSSTERIARLSPPQILERITRARLHQKELDAELAALIDHAVELRIGWPDIAHRLGVTAKLLASTTSEGTVTIPLSVTRTTLHKRLGSRNPAISSCKASGGAVNHQVELVNTCCRTLAGSSVHPYSALNCGNS
jgi:hypothetical protein